MQLANCYVALSGSRENTVPKYGVTPAEIVVLNAIHGEGAVHDIEPAGEIARPNGEERERLFSVYGKAMDDDNKPIIASVFPGSGVQLPRTLREIGLTPDAFKALARASADTAPTEAAERNAKIAATTQAVTGSPEDEEAEGGDIEADPENVMD